MQESRVDVNDSCMCLIYAKVDVKQGAPTEPAPAALYVLDLRESRCELVAC